MPPILTGKTEEVRAAGQLPAACDAPRFYWGLAAGAVVLFSAALTAISGRFGYDVEVIDMPCVLLTVMLVLTGATFAFLFPRLITATDCKIDATQRFALAIIVAAGFLARLILLPGEPILEDDYHRYLWDGAVTANGYNPYAQSPLTVMEGGVTGPLGQLSTAAGTVLPRINNKSLTTIYPPVAQSAFAAAYLIQPWSLTAWKGVLLLADLATLVLLILLLDAAGRSRLWSAIYWLNPVVLKELFNSAHMEGLLLPLVLASLLLSIRRYPLTAIIVLGLAAGAKLWPALLFPLIARPLWSDRTKLAAATLIFTALLALWIAPMLTQGLGQSAGLIAYLDRWQTNSAHFPMLVGMIGSIQDWLAIELVNPGVVVRVLVATVLVALALALSRRPIDGPQDLLVRASVLVGALVLLSPAQYPWYTVWMAPFLAFAPYRAFLLLTALISLYYLRYHFAARELAEIYTSYVVWLIWVPVWLMLLVDLWKRSARQIRGHNDA